MGVVIRIIRVTVNVIVVIRSGVGGQLVTGTDVGDGNFRGEVSGAGGKCPRFVGDAFILAY